MRPLRLFLLPLLVLLACQCGAPQPPLCNRVPISSRAPAESLVATAREQWLILADPYQRDAWPAAAAAYNLATARLLDQLRCDSEPCWQHRAAMLGTRIAKPAAHLADPATHCTIFPAAGVQLGKLDQRHTTEGIGVSLVGWRQTTPVGTPRESFNLPNGMPGSFTAILDFGGATPEWHFIKRWRRNELSVGNVNHTLAADWTAPNAFYWRMSELDRLRIQNLLLPERFMDETGLYFLTPYDPEKIPVVMVHGLMSSPDAYRFVINHLAPEPWFRENYQIWLYNYPTGNPWLFSGIEFRRQMRKAAAYARSKGHDRNLNRMVIIAHSMGGLIARSSVTDPGTKFYDAHFNTPLDSLQVAPSTRELIRNGLLYEPLAEPTRCIFLAVPHRGSRLASLRASLMLENLIRLPKFLTVDLLDAIVQSAYAIPEHRDGSIRPPTAIRSLSPDSRAIIGLDAMPLPRHIRFHSVIGDRGRGGDLWNSSDGVVPYWSSHVAPVTSEKIVPSNHSVPDHPAASAEIKRILKLHLREPDKR